MEIERKFLVKDMSWKDAVKSFHFIDQAYLAFAEDQAPEVRVRLCSRPRRKDDIDAIPSFDYGFVTVKSKGHISRNEVETSIDIDAAKEMMKMCQGHIISKTRYIVPVLDFNFEIDVYHGSLEGLVTAEVELQDEDEVLPSVPWLGTEVSTNSRYKNASMARYGAPPHPLTSSLKA